MALNRSQLREPALPKETVDVPEMREFLKDDGTSTEVVVQMMLMSERLQLATASLPEYAQIAEVLARSVVDNDGERVWPARTWEIFGTQHQDAAWKLFDVAKRLSKLGGTEEKNAVAPS